MDAKKSLEKKTKKGFRGYPLATVAFYGPTNKLATKVVVGIFQHEGDEPLMMKWYSDDDIRVNETILKEILITIRDHEVRAISMVKKIIGCTHEEGKDYPEGESCPECSFWENKDRWAD